MVLLWWEYSVIAAMFAAILVAFAAMSFSFARVRVQKWVGGAIGTFMQNLANQAAEEGGIEGSPSPGLIKLGGFEINVGTIKSLLEIAPQLMKLGETLGLNRGGGARGGGW